MSASYGSIRPLTDAVPQLLRIAGSICLRSGLSWPVENLV